MKMIRFFLGFFAITSPMITLADNDECKGPYKEYVACMTKQEAEIIKKYPNLMERKEKDLILKPLHNSNSPKAFSSIVGEADTETYWLVAYYPQYKLSYIKVSFYEGHSAYIYHHEYGSYHEVVGDIAFSPDGKYLVAFNNGEEAEFTPNLVRFFLLNNDWPSYLGGFENMTFGVDGAQFVTNDRIKLEVSRYVSSLQKNICYMKRTGNIWQFEKPECIEVPEMMVPLKKAN